MEQWKQPKNSAQKKSLILWLKLLIIKFPINNRASKKKLFNFLSTFNDSRLIPLLTRVIFYNFRIAFNRWAASLRWTERECRNFFNGFENNSLAIKKHKGRVSAKMAKNSPVFRCHHLVSNEPLRWIVWKTREKILF